MKQLVLQAFFGGHVDEDGSVSTHSLIVSVADEKGHLVSGLNKGNFDVWQVDYGVEKLQVNTVTELVEFSPDLKGIYFVPVVPVTGYARGNFVLAVLARKMVGPHASAKPVKGRTLVWFVK